MIVVVGTEQTALSIMACQRVYLAISSEPVGAKIFLDGKFVVHTFGNIYTSLYR
jgi:hypothetical protein